jgi:hypothetical protein
MRIHETNNDGARWMWTDGLATYEQSEIAVPLNWNVDDWRSRECQWLLAFIERYVTTQSNRITSEQTMAYGWTTLRFRASRDNDAPVVKGKLIIQEIAHIWSQEQTRYRDGCNDALLLKRIQDRAFIRHRITGESIAPNRLHLAIVCVRLNPHLPDKFFMQRLEHASPGSDTTFSGWFIGCDDRSHDHDRPENLISVHLSHLVEQRRDIFPYLSLPAGSAVAFEPHKVIVFAPDSPQGHAELIDPLADLDDQV